jgi:RNA polymerase sigma-70 factor (ECF subfamily)
VRTALVTALVTDATRALFAARVLPHLGAAYNLARWLVRDDHDAQDVVQDAMLRALRHVEGLRGGDARPWLLAIVRHAAFAWLAARRPGEVVLEDDELDAALAPHALEDDPESLAIRRAQRREIDAAIAALPIVFREAIVLRELEELPYRDIARITDVPIGTVMSRLSRARGLLAAALRPQDARTGT